MLVPNTVLLLDVVSKHVATSLRDAGTRRFGETLLHKSRF
jgi:hypothetical protein